MPRAVATSMVGRPSTSNPQLAMRQPEAGLGGVWFTAEPICYKRHSSVCEADTGTVEVDCSGAAATQPHHELRRHPGSSTDPASSTPQLNTTKDPTFAAASPDTADAPRSPLRSVGDGPLPQAAGSSAATTHGAISRHTRLKKGVIQPVNYKNIHKYGLVCSRGEPGEPNTLEG
ncbi:hypothetical protein D1007_39255 [Hordeum vulgare]|nr:hypothetical protein D1007_39255 [Hordeum vulgare]